jgi:hypothetical protein
MRVGVLGFRVFFPDILVVVFDFLPEHPMVTLASVMGLLGTTKPSVRKVIEAHCRANILR